MASFEDENAALRAEVQRLRQQAERLAEVRRRRDPAAAAREIDDLREACRGDGNLLERFVSCAHAYCTLGEIAGVLREEFGEYQEPKIL